MFDTSTFNYFKFLIFPLLISVVNVIFLLVNKSNYWYLPLLLLLLPSGIILYEKLRDTFTVNSYKALYKEFLPIINKIFSQSNIEIKEKDIIINITEQINKRFIKVIINI